MNHIRRGIAITDLLALAAILFLIAAIGVPTLERARELSKRAVCAINLKALGGAGNVYADANKGQWMTPAFSNRTVANNYGITYTCDNGFVDPYNEITCVGFARNRESTSETLMNPTAGSTAVSTTRAYWMMVRSGDVSAKQFSCPSSNYDFPDPTTDIDSYYDFQEYRNISYGYLVPFGPIDTRPRVGADNRIVLAADKGPNYLNGVYDFLSAGPNNSAIEEEHAPIYWTTFNSPNHGGTAIGEGQNVLHADGNVGFYRKPLAGADSDNIYTLMQNYWGVHPYGRTHGYSPHTSPSSNPFPGKGAFGTCSNCYSSTDSLIYP